MDIPSQTRYLQLANDTAFDIVIRIMPHRNTVIKKHGGRANDSQRMQMKDAAWLKNDWIIPPYTALEIRLLDYVAANDLLHHAITAAAVISLKKHRAVNHFPKTIKRSPVGKAFPSNSPVTRKSIQTSAAD